MPFTLWPQAVSMALTIVSVASAAAAEPSLPSSAPCHVQNNVGALFEVDPAGRQTLLCSGVLIEDDIVLTAAHCVTDNASSPELSQPMRFVFVLGERPYPTREAQQFTVAGIRVRPGFMASELEPSPLFAREPSNDIERDRLKRLEQQCGKRDPNRFGNKEWMQCLLEQPVEMQRAVGLDDGERHDNDLALLILQPNYDERWPDKPIFPKACDVRPGKLNQASDVPKPKRDIHLRLVGYGFDPEDPDASVLERWRRLFFRPVERRNLEVRVERTSKFEIALTNSFITCVQDSGAALFTRTQPTRRAQLVGIFSRPAADNRAGKKRKDCNAGGIATFVGSYWPWIDEELAKACKSQNVSLYQAEREGMRHHSVCLDLGDDDTPRRKRRRLNDPVEMGE